MLDDKKEPPLGQRYNDIKQAPLFSILIPTYNERENVKELILSIQNKLSNFSYEIIVIDDNSPDKTYEVVRNLSHKFNNIFLYKRNEKKGLGSAYKEGFTFSKGDFIIEIDSDLSHDPEDIPNLYDLVDGADIVIGSRYVKGGKIIGWNLYRKTVSKVANFIARRITHLEINDLTSGYRLYRRNSFDEIIKHSTKNGFEFQVEVLYIANKLGYQIRECPISFINRIRGKSKFSIHEIINFIKVIYSITKESVRV